MSVRKLPHVGLALDDMAEREMPPPTQWQRTALEEFERIAGAFAMPPVVGWMWDDIGGENDRSPIRVEATVGKAIREIEGNGEVI